MTSILQNFMTLADEAYKLLKKVPKGKVTTYKELARALDSKAYRAIGQAMRKNPHAPEVPCHRCVTSNGNVGGFKGKLKGKVIQEKINMLKEEGIVIENKKIINFESVLFKFP